MDSIYEYSGSETGVATIYDLMCISILDRYPLQEPGHEVDLDQSLRRSTAGEQSEDGVLWIVIVSSS